MGEDLGDHGGCSMAAMIFNVPPHWRHFSTTLQRAPTDAARRLTIVAWGAWPEGTGLPAFVEQAFRDYLTCGVLDLPLTG